MKRYVTRRTIAHYKANPFIDESALEKCAVKDCTNKVSTVGISNTPRILCASHRARATKYGLSDMMLTVLLDKTECDACHTTFTKRPHIDHDHKLYKGQPGYVRGLLCGSCNVRLGKNFDSIYNMTDGDPLIAYLTGGFFC